jgi:arylsulfatase A-like enzyme
MRISKPYLRKSFVTGLGIWAILLFGTIATSAVAANQVDPLPNIVFCMADDQGWGDVGYYGHEVLKTPVLDEMAASGLRFDRFYAAAPVCSPTRGSVLTGRHPNRFGCFLWGHTLRPQEVTVAEALKTAGYTTGHFGKWHLGPVRAASPVSPGNSGFDHWFSSPNFYENNPLMSHNGKVVRTEGEGSEVTVDAAIEFIRTAARDKQPFLAIVWFGSPHTPHEALPDDLALYEDQPARLQHYYGEITAMDRAVGNLRQELRDLGIADNTLFWYTSDNGPQGPDDRRPGSTGGLSGRKGSLWEGGLRVPTIIEWPARIKSPRITDIPSNTSDFYPTVLDIAGVTVPNQPQPLDGVSLLPVIDGRTTERPQPMGFWQYPGRGKPVRSGELLEALAKEQEAGEESNDPELLEADAGEIKEVYSESERPGHAAWMDGDYKLHRIPKNNAGEDDVQYSLFDLSRDPREKEDLIDRQPERAEKMKAELEAWQKSVIRSLNGTDYVNSEAEK